MRTNLTLVCLVALAVAQPALAARHSHRVARVSNRRFEQVQSESRIEQIPEGARVPRGVQLEISPTEKNAKATAPANSTPTTCTAENANNPACYTATQQSRPITK